MGPHPLSSARTSARRAFTLLEGVAAALLIGIVAALCLPRSGVGAEDPRTAALQSSLGGVRAAIAGFRTDALLAGKSPFPTIAELRSPRTVVPHDMPVNPFNNLATVQEVTAEQAAHRATCNQREFGWNYFVDNAAVPPRAIFYANTDDHTAATDATGSPRKACDL